ncbi:MAG TPA: hypothetical protein DDW76_20770 [Cyanobacteria bacterium UBA11369]|nr:hypothetical protein [Cyanobacteria bacterium UBA11371]HBE17971.1 hypothetical protein [Cyanobacteria bacterium UBA11367]HBE30852.1 hypothetical protein [Cyanobacteria bacterium UBA11368]HBE51136.1 hypothetical protein [Cyanobacteria bacterium UBA11369]
MDTLIEEIVRKLHDLPEVKILEVLDFIDFLTWHKDRLTSQQVEDNTTRLEHEEFEAIADQLANEFKAFVGANTPVLSDYGVSRAGIYEEHP